MQPSRRPPILWNVVQEHLDEAAFFFRQRSRTLRAPDHALNDLADGDERRLRTHLDGLQVGGRIVAERLLRPVLEEGEDWERCAAAHALLEMNVSYWGPHVLRLLKKATPEQRPFLTQALALSESMGLDTLLCEALPAAAPELQAGLLDVLRVRRADITAVLGQLSLEASPELLAAAIRAARHAPEVIVYPLVNMGLDTAHVRCREAAIEVGWVRSPLAVAQHSRTSRSSAWVGRAGLTVLAMSGDKRGVTQLLARMEEPGMRAEALWALGFSGCSESLEALLRIIRSNEDLLAAEAFRLATGMPLEEYLVASDEEQATPVGPATEDAEPPFLPGPTPPLGQVRVESIDRWWHAQKSRFPVHGRYVWGKPWTPEAALQALTEVPMPRRPALAWELAVRSGGTCWIETSTWSWRQVRQIRDARGLRIHSTSRAFDTVLASVRAT